MAKIIITNQPNTQPGTQSGTHAGRESVVRSTGRQVHFLDVWGDIPPSRKSASLSVAVPAVPDDKVAGPAGPANSRYSLVKSTLVNWCLIAG